MLSDRSAIRAAGLGAEQFPLLLLAARTHFPCSLDPAWECDFRPARIAGSRSVRLGKWTGTLYVINKLENMSTLFRNKGLDPERVVEFYSREI
jgi:hypothetical protein